MGAEPRLDENWIDRGSQVWNCRRFPKSAIPGNYDEDWNTPVYRLLLEMAHVRVSPTELGCLFDAPSHFVFRNGAPE